MPTDWEKKEWKRNWARKHPDKVAAANRRWRQIFKHRYNPAAAARMRRYRQRKKFQSSS